MTMSAPSEPGDLLADVAHLCALAMGEQKPSVRGTYARATIVLGLAAIEAVTNDALAAMQALLKTTVPAQHAGKPPWCHFEGRSQKYLARMLRRSRSRTRRAHVLSQIKRVNRRVLEAKELAKLDELARLRNRIVHMNFQSSPVEHQRVFDADEAVKVATLARDSAQHYVAFVAGEFAKLGLPIENNRTPEKS
jgi:hypothetical protein